MSWAFQPLLPSTQLQSKPTGTVTGYIKFWDGSNWVVKPVKYWTGSQWVQKPLKYYNGSQWIATQYTV